MSIDKSQPISVVTGGGRGIGFAIAVALARQGHRVAVLDVDSGSAEAAARELEQIGARAIGLPCDVVNEDSVAGCVDHVVSVLGTPTALVNNVGIAVRKPILEMSLSEFDHQLGVNLRGAYNCTRQFGAHMVAAARGAIVNISSITGAVTTEPGLAGYAASKAGIVALTRTTAIEWGPYGVRCNCVSPGQVPTPATQAAYDNPGVRERRTTASPLRELPDPADIASVVVFLLSREAHFINAQNIVVDGGLTHNLFAQVPGREILIEVAKVNGR